MKTIEIRPETLVKFIPSAADGDRIPGAVVRVEDPVLERLSEFEFCLSYLAHSKLTACYAECRLDEELEVVRNSNRLVERRHRSNNSGLIEIDGNRFRFDSSNRVAVWENFVCSIPNPFDDLGAHALSEFVRWNRVHLASIVNGSSSIALAIVSDKSNSYSRDVVNHYGASLIAGAPCLHNEGLLLPWSSAGADGGIKIEWLDTNDVSALVDGAVTISGCEK